MVPDLQGKKFDASFDRIGVPSTLLTVEGGGHGNGFGMSVQLTVKDFLENHLFGKSNALADKAVPASR